MDPFEVVPFGHWSEFLKTFHKDWPKYAHFYNWLLRAIKWKTKNPLQSIVLYRPRDQNNFETLLSVEHSGITTVVIFTLDKSNCLLQFLMETKVLNWDKTFWIYFSQLEIHQVFEKLFQEKLKLKNEFHVTWHISGYFFKPKEDFAELEIERIPAGFEIKPIQESNLPLICSLWPIGKEENPQNVIDFFKPSVKFDRCVGLFKTDDGSLVAWCFHGSFGGVQYLQTHPDFQRRGFGKIVLKYFLKQLSIEDKIDPTLFIMKGNTPSAKLFESLGFVEHGQVKFWQWRKKLLD